MQAIRRRLVALVLAALTCHVAVVAATQVVFCRMAPAATSSGDALACTCAHGSSAGCPMHKKKATSPSKECHFCAEGMGGVDAIITALLGVPGLLVGSHQVVAPARASEWLNALLAAPLTADRPPTSPPPRV